MAETDQALATKTRTVLLWAVTVAAALGVASAGITKFTVAQMWNDLFTDWGYSIAFKTLIGVLEIGGAALLLVPRFATYAATLLMAIMLGAIYTVFVNDSDLGYVANTAHFVLFAIVAYARWGDRWTPGG